MSEKEIGLLRSRPNGVKVRTNFFRFNVSQAIIVYKVSIEGDKPTDDKAFFGKIIGKCRDKLQESFKTYMVMNSLLYSPTKIGIDLEFESEYEGKSYTVSVNQEGMGVLDPKEAKSVNFFGRFYKMMTRFLRYKQIGKKMYNADKSKTFSAYQLDCWPGYDTCVKKMGYSSLTNLNILLNIDTSFKVIRRDTVLAQMQKMGKDQKSIEGILENQTVMSQYNKRFYRISKVLWGESPNDTFQADDETKMTFKEYYQKKWNITIKDMTQPLMLHVDRKTLKEAKLVPELCCMTGLDDSQRNNFNLMKELGSMTKPSASQRLQLTKDLIIASEENEKSKKFMQEWMVQVDGSPQLAEAVKLKAGDVVMNGGNFKLSIDNTPTQDYERKIQTTMFKTPSIVKWAVLTDAKNQAVMKDTFLKEFQMSTKQYNFPFPQPTVVLVRDSQESTWRAELRQLETGGYNHAVFILSGPKKKGQHYDMIKKYTISIGISTQMLCASTLGGNKGARSIVNKILVQICAKTGGVPWVISDMPLTSEPTMVVGIDVYHKTGSNKKSVFAFVSTTDRYFSQYNSQVVFQPVGQEIGAMVQQCTKSALEQFKAKTQCYPKNIVVYRDGVSDGQRNSVRDFEVTGMRNAFKQLGVENSISLVFITVNKLTNSRFYSLPSGDNGNKNGGFENVQNPTPGTLVDDPMICSEQDFYIIAQKTTQGLAAPSHYFILENDLSKGKEPSDRIKITFDIEKLSYKLCYLYYNWSGSVKVPAPIQYAHRLSNFVGDRWGNDFQAHQKLSDINSLYFL